MLAVDEQCATLGGAVVLVLVDRAVPRKGAEGGSLDRDIAARGGRGDRHRGAIPGVAVEDREVRERRRGVAFDQDRPPGALAVAVGEGEVADRRRADVVAAQDAALVVTIHDLGLAFGGALERDREVGQEEAPVAHLAVRQDHGVAGLSVVVKDVLQVVGLLWVALSRSVKGRRGRCRNLRWREGRRNGKGAITVSWAVAIGAGARSADPAGAAIRRILGAADPIQESGACATEPVQSGRRGTLKAVEPAGLPSSAKRTM